MPSGCGMRRPTRNGLSARPTGWGLSPASPAHRGTLLASGDEGGAIRLWTFAKLLDPGSSSSVAEEVNKLAKVERMGNAIKVALKPEATDEVLALLAKLKGLTELEVHNCPNLTEKGFAGVKELKELRRLSLSGLEKPQQTTDEWLVHLKGLPGLQSLSLEGCEKITDAGLVHLKEMTQLTDLVLPRQTTDAGLLHLYGLKNLKTVKTGDSKVTEAGIEALKKAIPGVEVSMP